MVARVQWTYDPVRDTNDGKEWSLMDLDDLRFNLENGGSVHEAAKMLGRRGTVDAVRRKAEEHGLI